MEAQHFFLSPSLRGFLQESCALFTIRTAVPSYMQNSFNNIDVLLGDEFASEKVEFCTRNVR
jgi:hypothetical protein